MTSRSATAPIIVGGEPIKMLAEQDPAKLPWGDLGVDVVLESTGFFTAREGAQKHLEAGAKKVLSPRRRPTPTSCSCSASTTMLRPEQHRIVSNASCTTNCVAPLAKLIDDLAGSSPAS